MIVKYDYIFTITNMFKVFNISLIKRDMLSITVFTISFLLFPRVIKLEIFKFASLENQWFLRVFLVICWYIGIIDIRCFWCSLGVLGFTTSGCPVPGATCHLHTARNSIIKNAFFKSPSTLIYIPSVLWRISLQVTPFWLRIYLFGFQIRSLYLCDTGSLGKKKLTIIKCMGPEHFEKTSFLIAMYTFTVVTMPLCVTEVFEVIFRSCFLIKQWPKGWFPTVIPQLFSHHFNLFLPYSVSISIGNINICSLNSVCLKSRCNIKYNAKF